MRGGFVPGDVASLLWSGNEKVTGLRITNCPMPNHPKADHWHTSAGRYGTHPDKVLPLVVIDPEDSEQARRLAWLVQQEIDSIPHEHTDYAAELAAAGQRALRSLIADPKPPEPEGLGAVVEDAEGNRYVRTEPDGGIAKWIRSRAPEHTDPRYVWSALPAVKVLFEGVTE